MLYLGKRYLRVHSIDLKEEKCEKCDKKCYPSIFSSAVGNWKYSYVCEDCIVNTKYISRVDLTRLRDNFLKSMGKGVVIDTTWVDDEDKRELLDHFLEMEEEDKDLVKDVDLYKAHLFIDSLRRGDTLFSEQEMYNYFNFYGNNAELVYGLRELLHEDQGSGFLLDMYKSARKMPLTDKQMGSLRRSRKFRKLCVDLEEFWEYLPEIQNFLEVKKDIDDRNLKVANRKNRPLYLINDFRLEILYNGYKK